MEELPQVNYILANDMKQNIEMNYATHILSEVSY